MPAGAGRRHRAVSPRRMTTRSITTTCSRCFSAASPKSPEARYASLPSFTEEYAFSLEKDKKGYRIVSTTLTANYRYATRRKSVKAQVSKKHISESMAVSLRELFRLLIRQIEEPSPDEAHRGLNGTTHFFASTDNEGKTAVGETWSPNPPRCSADSSASATIRMLSATG